MKQLHNAFVLSRTLVWGFKHGDWNAAFCRGNVIGVIAEFFRSLMGLNTWPFWVEDTGVWDKRKLVKLLSAHGIASWGWGYNKNRYFFRVKLRQAQWARYLMERNEVPLRGRVIKLDLQQVRAQQSQVTSTTDRARLERSRLPVISSKRTPRRSSVYAASTIADEINKLTDRLGGL